MADRIAGHLQRWSVLTRPHLAAIMRSRSLPGQLFPSDAGHFPRADGHRSHRPRGCSQLVLLICVGGRGRVEMAGADHAVVRDDVVVLPPDRPHAYRADERDPWSLWWVHLAGRQLPLLAAEEPWRSGGVFRLDDPSPVVRQIGRMLSALEHGFERVERLHAA
jgi:AraC family transcriptional regulator, arabinose operon regulatory protein